MFIYRFGKRSDTVNQQEDAESLPRVSVTEREDRCDCTTRHKFLSPKHFWKRHLAIFHIELWYTTQRHLNPPHPHSLTLKDVLFGVPIRLWPLPSPENTRL